ncbi:O-methyltransferase, family 2 [Corchorus capsularis]|uniref:O-methyltransferase, family 2 n=1 Tax=Corchorus capsularis TaxID=210143 RepID=A0A1R3GYI6_COCAP|nr:O-methyltransferase, family 2 [Corchorus capsularis]
MVKSGMVIDPETISNLPQLSELRIDVRPADKRWDDSVEAVVKEWILHNWSDGHCVKLLKNCYKAIPDDGKVIVLDAVLPVIPEPNGFVRAASVMDFQMLAQIPGGKERTKQEFEALATQAGFSGIRYECFVCNLCLMEFFK